VIAEYKPDFKAMNGEEFDPSPANIEKRLTRSKLDNGLHLSLLPKQSRGGLVNATLELRFGDPQSLLGKSAASSMTASLLMRGTKNKTRQQIQEEMDRLNAQIRMGGGGIGTATVSIQTTAENLIPALKLAAEILREPAFPESDFDQIRKQQIEGIRRGSTDPAILAREELQKHLNTYPASDVRHYRTMDESLADLEKVTLDDVKKFHQQFYGASHGTLAVVGQFDAAPVRAAAAELFGKWSTPAPYTRITSEFSKVSSINRKVETPDKQNAQFEAGLRFGMTDKDPDYPSMVLANYMLGGEITARLPNRIRNREGLSYGVNTIFSAPADGNTAALTMVAIVNPGNAPKVEASFRDEMARTLRDGFSAAELDAAKKAYLDLRRVGRSQDQSLLALLLLRDEYDRTLDWDAQMDQKIAALTVNQVNAALRAHVDPAAFSIVKAGDFKAAGVYQ
jgi:zinc protease